MTYALLSIFFIEFALWMFGGKDYSNTSLFNLIFNFESITSSDLYSVLYLALIAFAGATIVASSFYQFNSFGVYAGISVVLLGFLAVLGNFAGFIHGQLVSHLFDFATPITMLIVAPLVIFYGMAVVEWVRSNN